MSEFFSIPRNPPTPLRADDAFFAEIVRDPGALRAFLESRYGRWDAFAMSPWERVEAALAHRQPDRVPFDFWAVPEVWDKLRAALDADDGDILRLLGIDCRMVTPRYVGSRARTLPDGTTIDAWGTHRRSVTNEFSTYEEYASHPLADAETVSDVLDWEWADSDEWDVSGIREQCARWNAETRHKFERNPFAHGPFLTLAQAHSPSASRTKPISPARTVTGLTTDLFPICALAK